MKPMPSTMPTTPTMNEADVTVECNVMVPMRDGIHLATNIYRPTDGASRLPVILERTPYGKQQISRSEIDAGATRHHTRAEVARYFAQHGYVVIYQDCRGRHDSEGEFAKYLSEAHDGEDTLRWIVGQPWCNGQVATKGLSYAAHTQMALACTAPPGLTAMVIDSGGFSSAYHSGIRQGGAFELKQVTWALTCGMESCAQRGDTLAQAALEAEDLDAWFHAMPWRPGHSPLRWAPAYERTLFDQWTHGSFDAFWRQPGLYAAGHYDVLADIPQVHISSWYDFYVRTALDNYQALSGRKRAAMRLVMGPWLHGDRNVTHSGDVEFGPEAAFDGHVAPNFLAYRLRWFDRWIKQLPNGVDDEPPIRLFLMGGGSGRKNAEDRLEHGGRWLECTHWPLPGTRFVDYFLQPDGGLGTEPASDVQGDLSYDFDPRRPVPTIGGAVKSRPPIFEGNGGAFDQREEARFFGATGTGLPISTRQDVLVFETATLGEDTTVVGPIVAHLFVSSSCLDTDFTIKLIDVYPPSAYYPRGFAMNLTDGILRCRYRKSWEHPEPLLPGEVCEVTVEAFATANLFKAGHRIRLDVSSSNFPKYDVNPNTGEPEGASRRWRTATNTVYTNRHQPSRVVLPIVPEAALRAARNAAPL